ncbi:zinc-dependent alcohol dehydrogenase [Rhodococcus qingshengii]|uniref:zinc-dependent alcohol dehydrogenase n=1 Tax=Rhodococcus qingshengii TaxID=334542 RepID=UPI001BE50FB9|nr:zinc-binding dehydrogenase [Rhodococcus qingshengii]MBT2273899.1 zinc-binding dehydrogenase [Rhodococcus qingshengii]
MTHTTRKPPRSAKLPSQGPKTLPNSATAIEYIGPETFVTRRFPMPMVADDEMIVEVTLCGVDGSEVHMFRGELDWIDDIAPVIFGDEILGRVAALGETAAATRGLDVGDRVVIEARWPCDGCRSCDADQYYLCERNGLKSGYAATTSADKPHLWGGYATHVFVPREALVYRVPDRLPDTTALVACSALANGVRWAERGGVRDGGHVVIIGPGAQGICCAVGALDLGATVTLVGLTQDHPRMAIAEQFGVKQLVEIDPEVDTDTTARDIIARYGAADVVIEVAGALSAKELALKVVAALGTVVSVAVPSQPTQPINWLQLLSREITIVSLASHPHSVEPAFALASALLERGMDLGDLVTDILPLESAEHAVRLAGYEFEARPVKVALAPTRS